MPQLAYYVSDLQQEAQQATLHDMAHANHVRDWAKQCAERAIIKLPDGLGRVKRDYESVLTSVQLILASSELADRVLAIVPHVAAKLQSRMPLPEETLRRNVASNADARGRSLAAASTTTLKLRQKRHRLECWQGHAGNLRLRGGAPEFVPAVQRLASQP